MPVPYYYYGYYYAEQQALSTGVSRKALVDRASFSAILERCKSSLLNYHYHYAEKHALSTGASREASVDNACAVLQKHA